MLRASLARPPRAKGLAGSFSPEPTAAAVERVRQADGSSAHKAPSGGLAPC